jgi:hypothetical protein
MATKGILQKGDGTSSEPDTQLGELKRKLAKHLWIIWLP